MPNYNSANREMKKRKLKEQMVSSDGNTPPGRIHAYREEDSEEVIRQPRKMVRRKKKIIFLILLIGIAAGCSGWIQYQRYHQYTEYSTAWEVPISEGSYVGYVSFGSNVLKYTKDGASYLDAQGKTVWVQSYEMKTPLASVNGDFAVIADQGGNSIYTFGLDGKQGVAATLLPITKAVVSEKGVSAAILEDTNSSYISFYRRDGSTLDLTIKTRLSGDGYPTDLDLSKDGTQLLCSFVRLVNGELRNRVVFYDFSEIGRNVPGRLVGGFDEGMDKDFGLQKDFVTSMIGRVKYLKEPYSCVFADDSLTFFSSKNLISPMPVKQIVIDEMIQSICYSDNYAAVIVKAKAGSEENRMDMYTMSGEKVFSKEFSYPYTHVDIDGDMVFLYNEDSCRFYNMSGVEVFSGQFDFIISHIRKGRLPATYIVTGPEMMKEIKLQK